MASVKVKFRQSAKAECEGTIYYQVIHRRLPRQISTNYRILASEWNERRSAVVISNPDREAYLKCIRDRINWDLERLRRIIRRLSNRILDFSADDIVEEYLHYSKDYSFISYMENTIATLIRNGKVGTATNYRTALNSFRRFMSSQSQEGSSLGADDVMLDSITSELMESYEAWHIQQGNVPNTISFYTRIFRAIYKRAVDEGIIEDARPFKRVHTGVYKTEKRAIPLPIIRRMKTLNLTKNPKLDHARDVFMLSFYLRGMSFIDLCFLRKTDLKGGVLTYRRRKTGQKLTIAWTKEMQLILDKYPKNDTPYLLPILTRTYPNERSAYRNLGYRINCRLKEIGKMIDVPNYEHWSLYHARHSWASLARANGVPLSVISEAMGHDNERTTQIYLASLEATVVDRANAFLISLVE